MDSIALRQKEDVAMEVPEIDDGDLLVELLDASISAEDAADQQLGFASDVDGDCWIDSQELGGAIHTHQDCCEDCGLDGILSDFEEYGRYTAAPCVVFDDGEWAETGDAGMGPFTGGCMGDWYMDGMVMGLIAVGWEVQEEEGGEGSAFSFEPCYGGDGEAGTEQVYGSPLWE